MRTWILGLWLLGLAACKDGPGKDDSKGTGTGITTCDETTWYVDADEDGHGTPDGASVQSCDAPGPGYALSSDDCDDGDAGVNPDEREVCDPAHTDEDCNGAADDADGVGLDWYADADGDGYGLSADSSFGCDQPLGTASVGGDCDDADADTHPDAVEDCADPVDRNCDGASVYADADADGTAACEDCDDTNPAMSPDSRERCDGLDNDCDGVVDDDAFDADTWYVDTDGDGYGDDATAEVRCDGPAGTVNQGHDCNEADANIHPNAAEECNSGIDSNCDGSLGDEDLDGDGHIACEDCNDGDAGVFEPSVELCDGIDNDCDLDIDENDADGAPDWYYDADGDGVGSGDLVFSGCNPPTGFVSSGDDCDDGDISVGGPAHYYLDLDGDGYGDTLSDTPSCDVLAGFITTGGDCDDGDVIINPDGLEMCNGVDDDCDGSTDGADAVDALTFYADTDGDGYGDPSNLVLGCSLPAGASADSADCDDSSAAVFPGAPEVCDGLDNDCNGTIDGADAIDPTTWYPDADGDGWGDASSSVVACDQPPDTTNEPGDCDDTNANVSPEAAELCDGGTVDDNCDGLLDDADPALTDGSFLYADTDGDGYGAGAGQYWCVAPAGWSAVDTDCDDADLAVNPVADELCNGLDDDCDGTIDEDSAVDAPTWYADLDVDGFGDGMATSRACSQPAGFLADATDCNDGDAAISPAADERCDGIDNDCNTLIDDDYAVDAPTWYRDGDADGYGDPTLPGNACTQPNAFVSDNTDCDDTNANINPTQDERCDPQHQDEDCDGLVEDADPVVDPSSTTHFYLDLDSDSYGDPSHVMDLCAQPTGYVTDSSDCDDADDGINPDGLEICDPLGADEDCDGLADDDDPSVDTFTMTSWYDDIDSDTFGNPEAGADACDQPSGTVEDNTDCDDADSTVNPDATEICLDFIDNDCDGRSLGCGLERAQVSTAFYSQYYGVDPTDYAGITLDSAGDFNGDGNVDVLVGATGADDGGGASGAAYIVTSITAGSTELSTAGVTLIGESGSDAAGSAVASAGDVNGDGFDDVIVGAYGNDDASANAGAAYLVLGNRSGRIDLSQADVQIGGATTADQAGTAVDGRLDFDGDDVIDLVIGAWRGGTTSAGEVYVVPSDVRGPSASNNLVNMATEATLLAYGVSNSDNVGTAVSFVPDQNGDGLAELIVGVPQAHTDTSSAAGAAYIIAGGATGTMSLASADFIIYGDVNADQFGTAVSAGDVDGDGHGDIVVGAPRYDSATESDTGGAMVFLTLSAFTYASQADTTIVGLDRQDLLGTSLDATSDLDDDGRTDIVVGAPSSNASVTDGGSVYIVLGVPASGILSASDAEGRIDGTVAGGAAGTSVAALGDANGDTYNDLVFGASLDTTGGTDAGAFYLFTGSGP